MHSGSRLCASVFAFTLVAACGMAGLAAPPPGTALPGIAFVGGPIVERLDDEYAGSYHWRDGYVYPRGATYNASQVSGTR